MPFLALIIGVVIVMILLAVALLFGFIGAVRHGPNPDEGSKSTG